MSHLQEESPTPHFAWGQDNNTLIEESLGKKTPKSDKDVPKFAKNKEKYKKCKNKESSKSKNKGKTKKKSKEKSKKQHKSSKSKKKKKSSISLPIDQKCENPFDIFLQKKIKLRDDFDKNHSETFLTEKELAFQQFQMNEDADFIDN